ncbi:hypothetical protein CC79DRAFT_1337049, partial [Sarocladium strictum]
MPEPRQELSVAMKTEPRVLGSTDGEPRSNYPTHFAEFIKSFINDRGRHASSYIHRVITTLVDLIAETDDSSTDANLSSKDQAGQAEHDLVNPYRPANIPMPPSEDVIAILRWARDREHHRTVRTVTAVLPLLDFTEICRKVYFAVEEYSYIEFLLANGFLYYVFSVHYVTSGIPKYKEYYSMCRSNFENGLRRLPLFLPSTREVVAALTLGGLYSIERGDTAMASTFVFAGWEIARRLGYHLRPLKERDQGIRAGTQSLFWALYRLDRGLAVRLDRSASICDADITVPEIPEERWGTRLAQIQGYAYDQLHSPWAVSQNPDARTNRARELANNLSTVIAETRAELEKAPSQPVNAIDGPIERFYVQNELLYQMSFLNALLRTATSADPSGEVSEECIVVARDTLNVHQQCVASIKKWPGSDLILERYTNWVIKHVPFVAFCVLFTCAVQRLDLTELIELEAFAVSLRPDVAIDPTPSMSHPYRLYELLCQVARLYITTQTTEMPVVDPLQGPLGTALARGDDFFVSGSMDAAAENMEIHYTQTEADDGGGSWMAPGRMSGY